MARFTRKRVRGGSDEEFHKKFMAKLRENGPMLNARRARLAKAAAEQNVANARAALATARSKRPNENRARRPNAKFPNVKQAGWRLMTAKAELKKAEANLRGTSK
jgi:hypothetical protein